MYNSKFHCPRQSACLQNGSLFYTLLKTFKPIFKDPLKSLLLDIFTLIQAYHAFYKKFMHWAGK